MLRELLKLIVRGEISSQSEIAQALGVDETVLDDMIVQLATLGYLEDPAAKADIASTATGNGCGPKRGCGSKGHCAGCAMAGACQGGCFKGSKGKVWAVTDKGRKAAS